MQHAFTEEQYNAAIIQNELLQTQLNDLIEKLSKTRITQNSNNIETEKLREELKASNERAAQSASWYRQCIGTSEILRLHLEELANFLNSLLSNKETNIGVDRRRAIKKAIDRSLDLSKSFNMSLAMNESSVSGYDDRLSIGMQSITELLDNSGMNESYQRIFMSQTEVNDIQKKIINDLHAEITELKNDNKNKKKKESKDRKSLPLLQNQQNSESESWSEPDRNVSLARIGLKSDKSNQLNKERETSTESEESNLNYDKKSRQSLLKLEEMLMEKENKLLTIQCALVESDNNLKREKLKNIEIIEELKKEIDTKENKLIKINDEKEKLENSMKIIKEEFAINEIKLKSSAFEIESLTKQHQRKIDLMQTDYNKLQEIKLTNELNFEKLIKIKDQEINEKYVPKFNYDYLENEMNLLTDKLTNAQCKLDEMNKIKDDSIKLEIKLRNLTKSLDDLTLQNSKIAIERTRILSEKNELENKIKKLEQDNNKLKMSKFLSSSETEDGGCSSNQENQRSHINSSPDLGIESDVNRPTTTSSVELTNFEHQNLRNIEIPMKQQQPIHDCHLIEIELSEIKSKYNKTRDALENCYSKLRESNLIKQQKEKDIRQQILKTHNVLKVVRTHMEDANNLECENHNRKEITTKKEEKEN